jgi:hypothetical protein
MARRKNRPEAVQEKCQLAERLREIRTELFGERGGSEMARRLGIPVRTWYNYESGVTVPAEVLLRFLELTSVEPIWLLHGRGSRFRTHGFAPIPPTDQVRELLRSALDQLAQRDGLEMPRIGLVSHFGGKVQESREEFQNDGTDEVVMVRVDEGSAPRGDQAASGPAFLPARREHVGESEAVYRCLRVEGDAMVPLLADGAYVAYSDTAEPLHELTGSLVVAWIDGKPIVRWFELAGRYGVLRAENPKATMATYLVDFENSSPQPMIRRVLWTNTPHS